MCGSEPKVARSEAGYLGLWAKNTFGFGGRNEVGAEFG